jgi:hypothetical protein
VAATAKVGIDEVAAGLDSDSSVAVVIENRWAIPFVYPTAVSNRVRDG